MPKSYPQYKYENIADLGLDLQNRPFIHKIKPLAPSGLLKQLLEANAEMVLNTEKAKSEFIIAPILGEIARKNASKISFFSGHHLDVDKTRGLRGFCDFIFARVPASPFIREPIFCLVEAKNDNIERGIPQCIAEMFAARLLNEQAQKNIPVIYGCVTTGFLWQFLRLEGAIVLQDPRIFTLSDLEDILGALHGMMG